MRRDWISSCFDNILSLLEPGGVGSGSIYTIKPSSTPLVDKVEAEAVASSTPSTSTFQVLLGWINSMISMENLPIKSLNLPGMKVREWKVLSSHPRTFTPSGADNDHTSSSDQGVVSPTKDAVDFIQH